MPAWITPELCPVWWRAGSPSRSRTTTRRCGGRRGGSHPRGGRRLGMPEEASGPIDGSMKPMRVLVAGASGYVGSTLIPHLLERGHDVVAFGRDDGRVRAALD